MSIIDTVIDTVIDVFGTTLPGAVYVGTILSGFGG